MAHRARSKSQHNKAHMNKTAHYQTCLPPALNSCHHVQRFVRRRGAEGPSDLPVESLHSFSPPVQTSRPSPRSQGGFFPTRRAARASSAFRDLGPGMLFDTTRGKDPQTLQMRALMRSLHLVTRSTHQALEIISPWYFSRMILPTGAARLF